MATKIKLQRLGRIRQPFYRIVVADARTRQGGRVIETIGKYHPKQDPSFIEVDSERVQYWLGVGAQPTEPVQAILRVTGDWQQFRGEPAPPPMKTQQPKADKKAAFEAAAKESLGEPAGAATTPKAKKTAKKAAPAEKSSEASDTPADAQAGTAAETTEKTAETAETEVPAQADAVNDAAESVGEPAGEPDAADSAAGTEATES